MTQLVKANNIWQTPDTVCGKCFCVCLLGTQVMIETLEAVAVCVRHVCALEGACRLSEVRSVPSCVLYLLKNTFQHCKVLYPIIARQCF